VLVITDEELSPAADDADVVLPSAVDGVPFDSFAGLVVLVEALVEGVFQRVGTAGLERMRQWEESVLIHRAFRAGPVAPTDDVDETDDPETED
jgi:DNA-binding MurR/RpiR family transcriptional regulator